MPYSGGSGGGSSIQGASDVFLNGTQNNQVLAYNASTSKWVNANSSAAVNWQDIGEVALDSFAGANDDAKLAAAMSYVNGLTYKPIIRMSARKYTFTQSLGTPFDGFSLVGAGRGQIGGFSSTHPAYHTTVDLEIPATTGSLGYWIDVSGTWWDGYIGGINFISNNAITQFLRAPYPSQIRECTFENLTFQALYSVFGNKDESCAMTICNLTGGWQILNCRSTAMHIGGSDNRSIFGQGVDFYQDATYGAGGQQWMMICDQLTKSNVGPMYITAWGGWRGLKVMGSQQNGCGLSFTGCVFEGNNAGQPCDGSLVRVEGGVVTFRDCVIDCGMKSPAATASVNSTGIADRGLVEVLGSDTQVVFDGINFDHATGVANTTPCIYASGSSIVRVRNVMRSYRGGSVWGSQLPVVHQTSAGLVADNDTSIVLT